MENLCVPKGAKNRGNRKLKNKKRMEEIYGLKSESDKHEFGE